MRPLEIRERVGHTHTPGNGRVHSKPESLALVPTVLNEAGIGTGIRVPQIKQAVVAFVGGFGTAEPSWSLPDPCSVLVLFSWKLRSLEAGDPMVEPD